EFAFGGITEGVILVASRAQDPTVNELIKTDFPFVVIGRSENPYVNWVDNDNFVIGYQLAKHFI
ncbi:MAG TPA: transcriptional regulator, partial [Firmicutes bacterium]|nr:transcriptional regulator [Bacillota bacterium]